MIILNDLKINTKFQNRLELYKKLLNFKQIECPSCHSKEYIRWGTYERGITYYKNDTLCTEILIIQRIRCKSCNKTHALLPFGIIPYKQLTDEVIIDFIFDNKNNLYYSEDTIKNYKTQFKKTAFPYLVNILKTSSITSIYELLKENKNKILTTFIKITNRCFMQIKLGILGMCPL